MKIVMLEKLAINSKMAYFIRYLVYEPEIPEWRKQVFF